MRPLPVPRLSFAPRLAALYIALFVFSGIQLPFFPIWLKAKGIDASLIGLVVAVPSLVRVFGIPFAAREADRRDALRLAIVICACASVAAYVLVGLSAGALAIFLTYSLASLFYAPVMPLTETYALMGLSARGRAYGPVRLWGSVAFVAASFATGIAIEVMPARDLIWMLVAASVPVAFASLALLPIATDLRAPQAAAPARRGLLRDRGFLAVLAAGSLIQASHAVYYGFSSLQWRADGLDGGTIAALWAIGVVAEIVLFAVSGRLTIPPAGLLMLGAAGALVRWGVMMLDPPAALLPVLQILHALSFGATHLGALTYVARRAGEGEAATAQGHLAIALSAVMAGASALAGPLYAHYGVKSYAAMALMAVAGGVAARIAGRAGADMPRA
ncbi:MAG TPA: MFS transporter [Pseudolabrys sp.]|nr:MFS transporter [Pseudolabrys sp.]